MKVKKKYDKQTIKFVKFIFLQGMDAAWWTKYNWKCQPVDWSRSPDAMRIAWAYYMYFLAKMSELLDTVKNSHDNYNTGSSQLLDSTGTRDSIISN